MSILDPKPGSRRPFRARQRARGQRIVKLRQVVPSAITTLALCCGLASLHFSLVSEWEKAMLAILLSAILDTFDGLAARLLQAQSRFGAVLDSLADFLSFGVAPAMLLHQWMLKDADVFGIAAVMSFVLCSALRLARFTSAPRRPRGNPALAKFFVGMPTPAAAAVACIPPMIESCKLLHYRLDVWVVVVNTILIAVLMISRVPMFALKHARVRRKHVMWLLLGLGLIVVGLIRDGWLMTAAISAAYLLSIPLTWWQASQIKSRAAALQQAENMEPPRGS